jgi:hypothetical protein
LIWAILFLLLMLVTVVLLSLRTFGNKNKFLLSCEYWVYLPTEDMPPQEAIMKRMIGENPHSKHGTSPIGAKQGLLFSDIRLTVTQVLRSKNPFVFRPDLFGEHSHPDAATLEALATSRSMVRVRYISEEPVPDERHLQFLPHFADAAAQIGNGTVVYDNTAQKLYLAEDFYKLLDENLDVTGPDVHLTVVWEKQHGLGFAETRGFIKKGMRDLVTGLVDIDQEVLVKEILMEAARVVWNEGQVPQDLDVECFDDIFRLHIDPQNGGKPLINIARVQAV